MPPNLNAEGFRLIEGLITPGAVDTLLAAIDHSGVTVTRSGGVRNLAAKVPAVAELARSNTVREVVRPVLGPDARLVRSILFDKLERANWNMRWHQDVTIAVRRRLVVDGYGPWSVKEGVVSVQPPATVLEAMLAVRVHLDPCDEANGALRVVPGSHRFGRLDPERRAELIEIGPHQVCATGAGDALLMRPLLLHSSGPSARPGHRRVVHMDFAAGGLDGGLEWSEEA